MDLLEDDFNENSNVNNEDFIKMLSEYFGNFEENQNNLERDYNEQYRIFKENNEEIKNDNIFFDDIFLDKSNDITEECEIIDEQDENIEESNITNEIFENENSKIDLVEASDEILLVIDRIEGNIAVCENRETEEITNIDISKLPENVHEGDVLKFSNNQYEIDEEAKAEIEERIKNKMKNIFEDN